MQRFEVVDADRAVVAHRVDSHRGVVSIIVDTSQAVRRKRGDGVIIADGQRAAEQLDEIHSVVDRAEFIRLGYRSATDWLAVTTGEGIGHCKRMLQLAERIQHMPIVKRSFTAGDIAESKLRLLTDAWRARRRRAVCP